MEFDPFLLKRPLPFAKITAVVCTRVGEVLWVSAGVITLQFLENRDCLFCHNVCRPLCSMHRADESSKSWISSRIPHAQRVNGLLLVMMILVFLNSKELKLD